MPPSGAKIKKGSDRINMIHMMERHAYNAFLSIL